MLKYILIKLTVIIVHVYRKALLFRYNIMKVIMYLLCKN